jgi:hypothetical protein
MVSLEIGWAESMEGEPERRISKRGRAGEGRPTKRFPEVGRQNCGGRRHWVDGRGGKPRFMMIGSARVHLSHPLLSGA